ncbi:MAG TPA: fatty acid desaturase [Polyangiales bacterium]|nr:fatty acid desaturase [Polyangiales bacterium]
MVESVARSAARKYSSISNARGSLDLIASWGVIALVCAWLHFQPTAWAFAIAFVVISSRQALLANLAHDAWHTLCFRPRRLNDWIGALCYAYPVGIPFHHDRARHFTHHRRVGHADDPDWVNYSHTARQSRRDLARFFAGRLFGSLLVETALSVLKNRGRPRVALPSHVDSRGPRHEMLRVALVQLALVVLFGWSVAWWAYGVLWLLPLATLTAFCNSLRAFAEHAAQSGAEPAERLRDLDAGLLSRLFLCPAHFNFHALHHEYPSVPHYRLRSFRSDEAARLPAPAAGYVAVLREYVAALDAARSDGHGA